MSMSVNMCVVCVLRSVTHIEAGLFPAFSDTGRPLMHWLFVVVWEAK